MSKKKKKKRLNMVGDQRGANRIQHTHFLQIGDLAVHLASQLGPFCKLVLKGGDPNSFG